MRLAIQTMLAHPSFVLRFERTPEGVAPGTNYRISDLELASRLSYFLWSSAPDDTLISLAAQNKLHETATLESQVRRMLADPKSEALADEFRRRVALTAESEGIAVPNSPFSRFRP